jgi:hypothetical protein
MAGEELQARRVDDGEVDLRLGRLRRGNRLLRVAAAADEDEQQR